jgi:hypothetical protein
VKGDKPVYRELNKIYGDLLECHIANLYSFYFKLFKYERYLKKNWDKDITCEVNDSIDALNKVIDSSEEVYNSIGKMPEISVKFITDHSAINHFFDHTLSEDELLGLLKDDKQSIDKTFDLVIHYSDFLQLKDDSGRLSESKKIVYGLFDKLQVSFHAG